jgi:peptidoglycan/xylan/chitin deacetylase (PgdA/CDA1 family)
MKCSIVISIVFLFGFTNELLIEAQANRFFNGKTTGPIVIFKADDYCGLNESWKRFFKIIQDSNICASIGIEGEFIQTSNFYIDIIKEYHNKKYINNEDELVDRYEFWNHGFSHLRNGTAYAEFSNLEDLGSQYQTLKKVQDLFTSELGFESNTFGPPYNSFNQTTYEAIKSFNENNNDQIKVWMSDGNSFNKIDHSGWNFIPYGNDHNYGHLFFQLSYGDNNEDGLSPGASINVKDIGASNVYPFLLIQIHPGNWASNDDNSFRELADMITLLKSIDALFVTPSYIYNKANNLGYYNDIHNCGDYYGVTNANAINSLSAGSCYNCNYTFIHNNANVSFTASRNIYLFPGFKSEVGSRFHAYMIPLNSAKSAEAQDVNKLANTELKKNVSVESKVYLYPNPNNGIFTIDLGTQEINSSLIIIYDLYGHEIKKINTPSSKETIDLSNQPCGIYTVQVLSSKCFNTYKIVKE